MSSRYEEIDLERITAVSISERGSTVKLESFGDPRKGGKSFRKWLESMPDTLAADGIRRLSASIRRSKSAKDRECVWMIGAHVVKCGLSRYLIELMKKGYVTVLAMNGAAAIHDFEIACFGETSEDVGANLAAGIFGFARETSDGMNGAAAAGIAGGAGLGEALGACLRKGNHPNLSYSLLAEAHRLGIPATVHVAIGTDILVQHPGFDGAAWGELTARDFRIFAARMERLGRRGGVALNIGSAVIMPEVFLKAFSVARNLGASFDNITTCNLDMIRHYRPDENVLRRPGRFGGESISITGHHEILIPLLYSAVLS
ncbi:MAG TPA: hypothetical protein ENO08_07755 [Candidatus Eisenbacteria bacterium]|uniref:Uncharacterized protein n=1 Tax=Eiseniibacteriota bacterium TaxID=2212470 RepID=A0A7V2AW33_UNCEI|nr:hypothetical protein [Candidatus Eisenbacteria bacterium]